MRLTGCLIWVLVSILSAHITFTDTHRVTFHSWSVRDDDMWQPGQEWLGFQFYVSVSFVAQGSHASWNSRNILDFNATHGKSWNSPCFSIHPWKSEFTINILKTGNLDQTSSMHSCQNKWLYSAGIPNIMSLFPWLENTGLLLVATKEVVRCASRKYGLSLPALLCDICLCNPDVIDWLIMIDVRQRIHFSILLITYKSINDMVAEYLCQLVSIKKSSRKLRSFSQIILQVPVSQLKSYGDCAFSVAAPTLWNRLPADIRNALSFENFKSVLKTHLFKITFTGK